VYFPNYTKKNASNTLYNTLFPTNPLLLDEIHVISSKYICIIPRLVGPISKLMGLTWISTKQEGHNKPSEAAKQEGTTKQVQLPNSNKAKPKTKGITKSPWDTVSVIEQTRDENILLEDTHQTNCSIFLRT